jgi:hypothetical protein
MGIEEKKMFGGHRSMAAMLGACEGQRLPVAHQKPNMADKDPPACNHTFA